MIYVLEFKGKGESRPDTVKLLTFLSEREADKYISANVKKSSEGHKYWTRFDIVEPGEEIEPYAE